MVLCIVEDMALFLFVIILCVSWVLSVSEAKMELGLQKLYWGIGPVKGREEAEIVWCVITLGVVQ